MGIARKVGDVIGSYGGGEGADRVKSDFSVDEGELGCWFACRLRDAVGEFICIGV